MKRPLSMSLALVVLVVASHSPIVKAQYAWIDENGVRQYSDLPPPPSTPPSLILEQGGKRAISSPAATFDSKAEPSLAEKNAEFQKRRMEEAEKEKKMAEETRLKAEKKQNCERAQHYERVLASGRRITRPDKNGERSFLSEEQREHELSEIRKMLNACK